MMLIIYLHYSVHVHVHVFVIALVAIAISIEVKDNLITWMALVACSVTGLSHPGLLCFQAEESGKNMSDRFLNSIDTVYRESFLPKSR